MRVETKLMLKVLAIIAIPAAFVQYLEAKLPSEQQTAEAVAADLEDAKRQELEAIVQARIDGMKPSLNFRYARAIHIYDCDEDCEGVEE